MAAFKNKDNGTWYVQFRYTDWKGERQQKLKRGFATKREALEWEREFLMEKQADVNMTFESFVALYERDIKPKLKLNTWLTKESIIKKKILPYFAKRKLSEITAKDIMRWQNEVREMTDCHGKPLSKTYLKTVHNHDVMYRGWITPKKHYIMTGGSFVANEKTVMIKEGCPQAYRNCQPHSHERSLVWN